MSAADPLDRLDSAAVERALAGTRFGAAVRVVDEVGSTIDTCRELADAGAPEGTVVIAERQSHGRGQRGASWFSPEGGVYLSALLRPDLPPHEARLLTLAAGLAACLAVREDLGVPARLKLPNDLLVPADTAPLGWRKLGGVLVDAAIQGPVLRHAIVSLGLNVRARSEDFPVALQQLVTSLAQELGEPPARAAVVASFLRRLDESLARLSREGLAAWARANAEAHAELTARAPRFALPVLHDGAGA